MLDSFQVRGVTDKKNVDLFPTFILKSFPPFFPVLEGAGVVRHRAKDDLPLRKISVLEDYICTNMIIAPCIPIPFHHII